MKAVVPDMCLSKTVRCHSLVWVLTLDRLLITVEGILVSPGKISLGDVSQSPCECQESQSPVETVDVGSSTRLVMTLLRTPRKVLIVSAPQEGAGGLHKLSQVRYQGPGTPRGSTAEPRPETAAGGGLPSRRPPARLLWAEGISLPSRPRQAGLQSATSLAS